MKTLLKPFFIIIFLTLFTNTVLADLGARDMLSVKTDQLYPQMIDAAKAGEWDKLRNALKLLDPLNKEIKKYLRKNSTAELELRQAISDKDKAKAQIAVRKYILDGIKALFMWAVDEAEQASEKKEVVRQAFLESIHLSVSMDKTIMEDVQNDFQELYRYISNRSQFIIVSKDIGRKLQNALK